VLQYYKQRNQGFFHEGGIIMKFKKIMLLITVVLTASFLAACAGGGGATGGTTPGDAPAAAADEEVTLRISWWGNQLRNDTTLAWLDYYSEQHPGVRFEAEFTDWSGYWDRLATQAAAGNLPDIIQQDIAFITQYWARGLLVNLTDMSNRGYLDISEVPSSILASGSFEGDLFALCIGVNARAIIYDIDVMEAAGVEFSDRPTYQELMDLSAIIFEATGVRGDTPTEVGPLQLMARSVGELIYDVDADGNNIIGASHNTVLRYFRQVYDTINSPWATTVEQRQDAIGVGLEASHLPTGVTWLTFPGGSNQLAAFQAATDNRLGITFAPALNYGATHEFMYLRPSQFFSITTTSQHQELAAQVICHFTNSEGAQLLLLAERGVPVNPRMADFVRPHLDPVQQTIFEYIARVTEVATPMDPPQPNGSAEANRLLVDLTEMVQFGMISYAEATDRFIPEANAILAVHQDD